MGCRVRWSCVGLHQWELREVLFTVGSTCANMALVPPSIRIGTMSFQLLFSSAASTYAELGVSTVLPGQKTEC